MHTNRPSYILACSIASLLAVSSSGLAAAWQGTISADVNDPANWDVNPSGQNIYFGILGNDGGPAPFRATLNANLAYPIVDLQVARGGGPAIFNHTAGTAATGNDNWVDVGTSGGTGTYNLANTAGTGGTLTGFAQGSGSVTATANGRIYVGGVEFDALGGTGFMNIHTTGSVNAFRLIVGEKGTGLVSMDSGTINLTNDMTVGFRNQGANIGNGTFRMSGGTVNRTGGWTTFGRDGGSQGHFVMSGGTVNTTGGGQTIVGLNNATGTFTMSGGTYNADGEFWVGNDPGGNGTMTVSGGSVQVGNWFAVGRFGGTGVLTISGTGVVQKSNANGSFEITNGGSTTASGIVNLDGGSLIVNDITGSGGVGSTAKLNLNGGTLKPTVSNGNFINGNVVPTVKAGGAKIDTNTFNITIGNALVTDLVSTGGGLTKMGNGTLTLSATNTYTGSTEVDAGTLLVTGVLAATSAVNVDAGATLGGSGTINSAATVTVASNGILSPGLSPGVLSTGSVSLSSGSDFVLEINGSTLGTNYDNLNVTGGVTLGSADLFVTLGNGFTPTAGETFTVVSNDLFDPIGGTFATINGGAFGVGDTFSLTNDQGTFGFILHYDGEGAATGGGNDVVVEVVPEPGVAISLLGGLGVLLGFRRRRA